MNEKLAFRALAKRLGNPLAADTDTAQAADATPRGERATADDRQSARMTLDSKLREAQAADSGRVEP